jgi:hypothetical protein
MSYIEISVKRNDGAWSFQKTISTEQSALEIFESMCVEVRSVLREPAVSEPAASEFEVISSVASTSDDIEHYAEEILSSSAAHACQTSRVSAERIMYAVGCGRACGRLLNGLYAEFPRDEPTRLRPNHYVLVRDRHGVCPENGIAVFNQFCDIEPLVNERHESSGTRTLSKQAIFKGLPSKSEVDAFIRGFREQQRSAAVSD